MAWQRIIRRNQSGRAKRISPATDFLFSNPDNLSRSPEPLSAETEAQPIHTDDLSGDTFSLTSGTELLFSVTGSLSGGADALTFDAEMLSGDTEALFLDDFGPKIIPDTLFSTICQLNHK